MAPVTDCIKLSQFVWTPEAEEAFQLIKHKLTTAPVLALPNFSVPFDYIWMLPRMALGLC